MNLLTAPVARIALVLAAVVLLAMNEVQRLAAQYVSSLGVTFVISDVEGVGAWNDRSAWNGWTGEHGAGGNNPSALIALHTGLDLAFIAIYATLALVVILRGLPVPALPSAPEQPTAAQLETHRVAHARRTRAWTWLIALFVADLTEDVLLFVEAYLMHVGVPGWLAEIQAGVSIAKWVAALLLAVTLVRAPGVLAGIRLWFRRSGPVLYTHRLAVLLVAVLAIVSLIPGALVLEQLPDIERSWFDTDGFHVWHGLFAVIAIVVTSVTFRLLGRKRSKDYRRDREDLTPSPVPAVGAPVWAGRMYAVWFAIPLLAAVGGVVALANHWVVDSSFWWFVAVTLAIPLVSLIFERFRFANPALYPSSPQRPRLPGDTWESEGLRMTRGGDLLAWLMISIFAIGVTRSLMPYLALGDPRAWLYGLCVGLAVIVAVVLPVLPEYYDGGSADTSVTPVNYVIEEFSPDLDNPGVNWVRVIATVLPLVAAVATITLSIALPTWFAEVVGPAGLLISTLTAWMTLVGLLILLLRRRRPLALFSALGLRSDPVIVLFLLIPVVVSVLNPVPSLHAIDQSSASLGDRPDLQGAFDDWLQRTEGCSVDGVRPLILVAAEGGGIRATTWTTAVLAEIARANPCLANSVFLSSGVSGGSVGLAIAANSGQNVADSSAPATASDLSAAAETMTKASFAAGRSPALGSAIAGLVVTDPVAAAVGIRTPNVGQSAWRDRAALIEDSWRGAGTGLDAPFDAVAKAPTGVVVLNSTDLATGCRVSTSQMRLDDGDDSDPTPKQVKEFDGDGPTCKKGVEEPPLTIDLISRYRMCGSYHGDWATSAMLSARFAYVTPSGEVDVSGKAPGGGGEKCKPTHLQLIDGGYGENSGLGLIADLAPRLAEVVRTYNSKPDTKDVVVPYLLYIQNSPGGYIPQAPRSDATQFAAPVVGGDTKAVQLATTSWVQRITGALSAVCTADVTVAGAKAAICAAAAAETQTEHRTIIAAIDNRPAVNVPLGWALSKTTNDRLLTDAEKQTARCPVESDSYDCLADLVAIWPN